MTYRIPAFFGLAPVALLAALFTSLPAQALYKVIGPDGKITYTDRPAVSTDNKVQPMASSESAATDVALPFELRQAVQRFPVTYYTSTDCAPCDTGRQLLRERGIPFSEKSISTSDDAAALTRLTGSSSLPALTVGAQVLRGFQRSDWLSYLDAAGYPKESRLPASYQQPQAAPLTEHKTAAPAPRPAAPTPSPAAAPSPAASGFRF
ncbi:MAG TPA: glutaredoxin family protein [Rhizobacter sp.]|nr:glutaredoxin family protein [Rhizobacter sp.]